MHSVGRPKIPTPCKPPFSEDAHNITIHLWCCPLVILGGVDIERSPVRVTRWRTEFSGHSVVSPYITAAVSIGIGYINESL
jgi:hypothetical protein